MGALPAAADPWGACLLFQLGGEAGACRFRRRSLPVDLGLGGLATGLARWLVPSPVRSPGDGVRSFG